MLPFDGDGPARRRAGANRCPRSVLFRRGRAGTADDRIVPMLDYELGIAWLGPQGHLRVAIGYMATYWFNIVSTPTFVDAVQADNYVNVSDTIAFDGAVGHVEWRW